MIGNQAGLTLGKHSYIGDCQLLFDPIVTVGAFTTISSQVTFFGMCEHPSVMNKQAVANFPFWDMRWGEYTRTGTRGSIVVGNDVWIGERAMIMDGVTIGDGAIIGAGAVVGSNVPDYAVMIGNPARVKRIRFSWDIVEKLRKIKWWEWSDEVIKERLGDMQNIETFVERWGV